MEDRVVMLDVIAWGEAWAEDRVVILDGVIAWDEARVDDRDSVPQWREST